MGTVKAITLKPLNGEPAGIEREFDQVDFDQLERLGAVKAAQAPANKMESNPRNKAESAPAAKRGGVSGGSLGSSDGKD